ncbi:Atu4866 domain-containing protein [Rhizobium puerariae]|uniref:Atu4866 domain-containing protein n=1 Tax=Rhizobium puerariae TaxID=1585791 RepID=A0ABV6AC30_9HYPH
MKTIISTSLGLLVLISAIGTILPVDGRASDDIAYKSRDALIPANQTEKKMQQHPYVGMWVTADGRIRQELLPNGRYDEARGSRQSAYQGRYEVTGNRINYWDDTGFTADGLFVDIDTLHHGGMTFFRQR